MSPNQSLLGAWPLRCWMSSALFLLASPAALTAQAPGIGLEARAGIGLPVGELAEFMDSGPAFGVKLLFGLSERVSVVADGGVLFLEGNPNVKAWSYLGGVRVRIAGSSRSRWSVAGSAAVGGTSFAKGAPVILPVPPPGFPPARGTLLDTSATLQAGIAVERRLGHRLILFLNGAWHRMFTDADDVTVEGRGTTEGFGATSAVPITVGLRFRP